VRKSAGRVKGGVAGRPSRSCVDADGASPVFVKYRRQLWHMTKEQLRSNSEAQA